MVWKLTIISLLSPHTHRRSPHSVSRLVVSVQMKNEIGSKIDAPLSSYFIPQAAPRHLLSQVKEKKWVLWASSTSFSISSLLLKWEYESIQLAIYLRSTPFFTWKSTQNPPPPPAAWKIMLKWKALLFSLLLLRTSTPEQPFFPFLLCFLAFSISQPRTHANKSYPCIWPFMYNIFFH